MARRRYANDWIDEDQSIFSFRDIALLAGGALLGLVGSRLMPPLASQAYGSARGAMGGDPFDGLAQDHRKFLKLLSRMVDARPEEVANRTKLLLQLKRSLAAHAMAEEDIVYPLLLDVNAPPQEAGGLYGEHAQMKIHLYALEHLPKDSEAWTERARALRALIAEHARQEEEIEFPRLRDAFDRKQASRVSGEVRREKALVL